jgi:hypothetical protein
VITPPEVLQFIHLFPNFSFPSRVSMDPSGFLEPGTPDLLG